MGFYIARSSALQLIDIHANPMSCENFRSCPTKLDKVFLKILMLNMISVGSK